MEKHFLITAHQLVLKRKWTRGLIRIFLSEPDMVKANPMYPRWPTMCFYGIKRVEQIENTKEFKQAKLRIINKSWNRNRIKKEN